MASAGGPLACYRDPAWAEDPAAGAGIGLMLNTARRNILNGNAHGEHELIVTSIDLCRLGGDR